MNTRLGLTVSLTLSTLILLPTLTRAANCTTNNVYTPYSMPFKCSHEPKAVTPAKANAINFEYTKSNNRCEIVSNSEQTVYLTHYINCKNNQPYLTRQKLTLQAGVNNVSFQSSCNKDPNTNHANLYIDNQSQQSAAKLMIHCNANSSNNSQSLL